MYEKNAFEIPELKSINNEIRTLNLEISKAEFASEKNKVNKLKKIQEEKLKFQNDLFEKYNINPQYLKPFYECKHCEDTGFENGEPCKFCFDKAYKLKLYELCGIKLKDIPVLSKINVNFYDEKAEENKKIIQQINNNLNKNKIKSILLTGKTGTGKTYISKSFVKNCIAENKYIKFVSAYNLVRDIYNFDNAFEAMQKYIDYDVLVIDDLGTEPKYKNLIENLLNIINERANKLTLINTNMSLSGISEIYGERILSRMANRERSLVFNFNGPDLNLKIRK